MRILFSGLVAATILVIGSAISWNAAAATVPGVGSLSPVTKSYVPIERVGYWRRQYRRAYRRGYYGYGYGYGLLSTIRLLPTLPVLWLRQLLLAETQGNHHRQPLLVVSL